METSTEEHTHVHEDNTTCPFLQLPRELRDEIYEYTLTNHPNKIRITKHNIIQPDLLHTCRQIRHEATPCYYFLTGNQFRFETRRRFVLQICLKCCCQYISATGGRTPVFKDFRKYGMVTSRLHKDNVKRWKTSMGRLGQFRPGEVEQDGD